MERNNVFKEKPGVMARTAELQVAMLQWYMLSKSSFCITNTVKASTFALTAVVAGDCQFVVVQANGECTLKNVMPDKEILIESSAKLKAMPGIKEDYSRKTTIWGAVEQAPKMVSEQECFKRGKTSGDIRPILPYWQTLTAATTTTPAVGAAAGASGAPAEEG